MLTLRQRLEAYLWHKKTRLGTASLLRGARAILMLDPKTGATILAQLASLTDDELLHEATYFGWTPTTPDPLPSTTDAT